MVLRPNMNSAKRIVSNAENIAPFTSKPAIRHLNSSLAAAARIRRTRKAESAVQDAAARRKRQLKTKKAPVIKMTITSVVDVEMAEAESPRASRLSTKTLALPRELPRADSSLEVNMDTFKMIAPEVAEGATDMEFVREFLGGLGNEYVLFNLIFRLGLTSALRILPVLSQCKLALDQNTIPREVSATFENPQLTLPTHALGVHGPRQEGKKTEIKFYPFHSLILGANCAGLPRLAPAAAQETTTSPFTMKLPASYLELPFPSQFPALMRYIYTKDLSLLFGPSYLPIPAPASLTSNIGSEFEIRAFATSLAKTFSTEHLVGRTRPVFELWANMCRIGVVDDRMWEAVNYLWQIYLFATAISSGNLDKLVKSEDASS
jgi:hypothetical protein